MKRLTLLLTIVMALCLASPALFAHVAAQDKPVDVSGRWALTVETAAGTGTPSVELKQDGETLTGNYSSQVFGEQKVTGTIKGNAITFGFTTSFEGSTVTVTYSGTADACDDEGEGDGRRPRRRHLHRKEARHGGSPEGATAHNEGLPRHRRRRRIRILEQVAEQRTRIADGLAGVRHLVAVGSGKGGVGKSTLTLHLAGALRARGLRIAILDADFNGPSQARMAGVQGALFVPGSQKVALPRTSNGIGVFSMGSVIPESEALEFESAAARRIAHVACHEGVRAPDRDPRVVRVGRARSAVVRPAARRRADRSVRRFPGASDFVRARHDPV